MNEEKQRIVIGWEGSFILHTSPYEKVMQKVYKSFAVRKPWTVIYLCFFLLFVSEQTLGICSGTNNV